MTTKVVYRAIGRRKEAVARIILTPGKGKRIINSKTFTEYFNSPTREMIIEQPFDKIEAGKSWDVSANVCGGGKSGQAEAVRLGIARALLCFNPELRKPMREGKFLTRDSRIVQRKHYGRAKARKRFQFSKR